MIHFNSQTAINLSTNDFFRKFLGVSFTNSYFFLAFSLVAIALIISIRIFTKRWFVKKASSAWNYSLYSAVFLGLIFGIVFSSFNQFQGLTVITNSNQQQAYVYNDIYEIRMLTQIYSRVFTTLISLIVGPLIFFGLSSKLATYNRSKSVLYSLKYLIIGVIISLVLGILIFQFFQLLPNTTNLSDDEKIASPKYESILVTIVSWLPRNVLASETFSYLSIGLLIFALILGYAIFLAHKKKQSEEKIRVVTNFLSGGFKIFTIITEIILEFMPVGVFGLFTSAIIRNGGSVFISLGWFVLIFLLSVLLLMGGQIAYVCFKIKMNPITYLQKAWKPLTSAFLTQSSNSTIPLTQKTLREKFHVDETSASSMPVIGTTMGMVACGALYPVMAAGFVYYVDRPFADMGLIAQITFGIFLFFSAFFSSFGLAGVPGVASVTTRNVFSAVNLPYATTIGSLLAIDPIIDMFRTLANVNGVIVASLLGDHKNKQKLLGKKSKKITKKVHLNITNSKLTPFASNELQTRIKLKESSIKN